MSRPAGREAFNAIRPQTKTDAATVQLDFSGVVAVTPSWVDEFLSLLIDHVGNRIEFLPTNNASVLATLKILVKAEQEPVASLARGYLKDHRQKS